MSGWRGTPGQGPPRGEGPPQGEAGVGLTHPTTCHLSSGAGGDWTARLEQAAGRRSGMYFYWGAGRRKLQRQEPMRGADLRQAASGERHSLLLLSDGTVHSCGDNSRGQLGRRGVPRGDRPGERGDSGVGRGGRQVGALGALGPLGLQL